MRTLGNILEASLPVLTTLGVISVLLLIYLAIDLAWYELKQADRIPANVVKKTGSELAKLHSRMQIIREARAKAKLRDQKAEEAKDDWTSVFEHPYAGGFDGTTGELFARGLTFDTAQTRAYNKLLDQLADTQIFENTEVI